MRVPGKYRKVIRRETKITCYPTTDRFYISDFPIPDILFPWLPYHGLPAHPTPTPSLHLPELDLTFSFSSFFLWSLTLVFLALYLVSSFLIILHSHRWCSFLNSWFKYPSSYTTSGWFSSIHFKFNMSRWFHYLHPQTCSPVFHISSDPSSRCPTLSPPN